MKLELNKEEIKLLLYWRQRCNQGHAERVFICPLYCLDEGTPFCHGLGDKLVKEHGKLLESARKDEKKK